MPETTEHGESSHRKPLCSPVHMQTPRLHLPLTPQLTFVHGSIEQLGPLKASKQEQLPPKQRPWLPQLTP
jgi:hypothetical protein